MLVDRTVDREWVDTITTNRSRPLRVLDPACGDGRLLEAVHTRLSAWGIQCELLGVDIDPEAVRSARQRLSTAATIIATIIEGDALDPSVLQPVSPENSAVGICDLFIANPPFISQMSAQTTRGGSSRHGGGPYADVAVEFCGLALQVTSSMRGRIAMILPQSLLTARDAGPIRSRMNASSSALWDWHSDGFHFDAAVRVCAIGRERHRALSGSSDIGTSATSTSATSTSDTSTSDTSTSGTGTSHTPNSWGHLIARARGVPTLGELKTDGVLGDRAELNANFRDQYYGLVPAVKESHPERDLHLPPLITTGLIDPGVCHWGRRPARFAKQAFAAPRVDLAALDEPMLAWAHRKLVPKVLVATQTRVIEAVADPTGDWLPGVPITSVTPIVCKVAGEQFPDLDRAIWELAAVLTSPVATIAAWWASAGSGLSSNSLRISPHLIAATPWPQGDLTDAVEYLRNGQIIECGQAVSAACGIEESHPAVQWWTSRLKYIEADTTGQTRAARVLRSLRTERHRSHPGDPAIIHRIVTPINSVMCTDSARALERCVHTSTAAARRVVTINAIAKGNKPKARCGRQAT